MLGRLFLPTLIGGLKGLECLVGMSLAGVSPSGRGGPFGARYFLYFLVGMRGIKNVRGGLPARTKRMNYVLCFSLVK